MTLSRLLGCLAAGIATLVAALPAPAQRAEPLPQELEGVQVVEHLSELIPLGLEFVDSSGKPVRLQEFFDGTRPVVLTMNYSNCPMLCGLQLNGLFEALKRMPWDIGDQFQMVTVSIDPRESSERASLTKQKYLERYGRPGGTEGWHFLTGREENIRKLAEAIGFRYRCVESGGQYQYLHAAVTFILTPDGRLSRYLYGVKYEAQTIRLSLLEAADGKIGTAGDKILLFCFHYDAEEGRYAPAAFRLMQFGCGATAVVVGGLIWGLRRREKRKRRAAGPEA